MKHLFTRVLLCTSAIVFPVAGALAQQAQVGIPPLYQTIDNNGVDLATGSYNLTRVDLSIGPASQGLTYGNTSFGDMAAYRFYNTPTSTTITVGGFSDAFACGTGSCSSIKGSGARISYASPTSATYTSSDGSSVAFATNQSKVLYPKSLTRPNGVVLTFTNNFAILVQYNPVQLGCPTGSYITYCRLVQNNSAVGPNFGTNQSYEYGYELERLQAVTTNTGYGLKLDYSVDSTPTDPNTAPWFLVVKATVFNSVLSPCNVASTATCSGVATARSVQYGTDQTGRQTITDPLGNTTHYRYGAGGLLGIQYPLSAAEDVMIAYDGNYRVRTITRPQGAWTYTYVVSGSSVTQTTVADPTGVVGRNRIVAFNPAIGRPTSDTVVGRTTSYQYDSYARVTRATAPQGNYTQYTYDARGNVLQTDTVANANGGGTITTKASYDASCANVFKCNKPNSTIDARGYTTSYTYDPTYGVLTDVTPPTGGSAAHYAYINVAAPGGGQVLMPYYETHSAGLPEATKTSYAYPSSGNPLPTSMTTGSADGTLSAQLTYTYTSDGDVQAVTGPASGMRTRYYYDLNRRNVGVVGPTPGGTGPNGQPLKNRAVQTNFDGNGRVKSIVRGTVTNQDDGGASFVALATQSTGYDAGGRATSSTVIAGSTTVSSTNYTYDAANRPLTTTILMQGQGPDRTTTNGYDGNGLLSTVTTATGTADASTITYGYTGNGKVASIQDGNLNMTRYAYDGFDRQQTTTYADGTFDYLTFDAASNVLSKQRRGDGAAIIGYTYDAVGNLRTRTAPGLSNSYNYDTLGRLTSATGGSYNVSRTYDALGDLLTDTTGGNGFTNHYDAAGRRTLQQMSGVLGGYAGVAIDYLTTGDLAHFYTISQPTATLVTFGYDDLGHETQVTRAAGRTSTYTYGADQRLASISHTGSANGAYDVTFGFTYNPAGQITGRTTSNDAYVYGAPASAQSYGVNALNQLAPTPTPFTYDARGNQTNVSNTPGATRTFDALDRVTSASQGGTTSYLTYDALDRLAGVQAGAGAPVRYVAWNGGELAGEWNSNGGPIFYAHDNEGRPFFGTDFSPNHWIHNTDYLTDERGSLVGETFGDGTVRAYAYDAYGREAAGAQHPSLIGYAGGVALPGAGLVHFRARAYDPGTGRFVSADPIGVAGGINIYGYAGGDPVNNVDPNGLYTDVPKTGSLLPGVDPPFLSCYGNCGGGGI